MPIRILTLFVIILSLFPVNPCIALGRNEIGLKVGYFNPKDYTPYFPIQSADTEQFIRYDQAILNIFYNRKINSEVDVGLDIGFTGVLDKSDDNTILNSYPISIYGLVEMISISGVEAYGGGGLDYWTLEKKEGGMQGLKGYHIRLSLRYQVLQADIIYASIDDFSENKYDIGGWRILVGLAYSFSYY